MLTGVRGEFRLIRKNINFDKSSLEIRWSQRRFSGSYVCETGKSTKVGV
jgi:hypothetical protein